MYLHGHHLDTNDVLKDKNTTLIIYLLVVHLQLLSTEVSPQSKQLSWVRHFRKTLRPSSVSTWLIELTNLCTLLFPFLPYLRQPPKIRTVQVRGSHQF